MSTYIGVGKSKLLDSKDAGIESTNLALKGLNNNKPSMVFVFSTFGYDFKELLKSVKSTALDSMVVGCSVFGVINNEGQDTELHRVLVCAIYSDDFVMTPVFETGLSNGSEDVGRKLKKQISEKNISDIKGLLLMVDGLHISDPDSMLKEIGEVIPKNTPVFGGSAGEPALWKNTYQFYDTEVYEDSVVSVIFSGNVDISVASSHGSMDLGGVHTVTKADGPRIYEIDDKPAMHLFKELYGYKENKITALTAAGVCLGVKVKLEDGSDQLELRIPLSSFEDESVLMAAAWPVGTKIYVCQRDMELIPKNTTKVIGNILEKHDGKKPFVVFEANCMGRSPDQIGSDVANKDIFSAIDTFGKDVPLFGGYMYGEFASLEGVAAYHNWTGSYACFYTK